MGIKQTLSPSIVHHCIKTEEIPLRSQTLPPDTVDTIFRYGAYVASTIQLHTKLDRGMAYARGLIREHEEQNRSFASGTVILAEELAAGKGRFQRSWHAPSGGIWLTLIIVNTLLPESTRMYPLAAGVACCEAIQTYVPEARLKWVNDVHAGGRKICGVLAETLHGHIFGEEYILIGIGINVNNEDFPDELASTAGSIKSAGGREVNIDTFAASLLAKIVWNIGLLHYVEEEELKSMGCEDSASGNDNLLLQRWRQLSDTIGRKVLFGFDVQKNPQYEAEVLGIDNQGGLQLRNLKDNSLITESSGELLYLD
jgi:BirA family biotin operon repressor/biotin-[acetyl-CoA-carboxylase] ligase